MFKSLAMLLVIALFAIAGCDHAPAQYDQATLRKYFRKSHAEVEKVFGKPKTATYVDYDFSSTRPSAEEMEKISQSIVTLVYRYSTPGGDMEICFNPNDQVVAITYAGQKVLPTP